MSSSKKVVKKSKKPSVKIQEKKYQTMKAKTHAVACAAYEHANELDIPDTPAKPIDRYQEGYDNGFARGYEEGYEDSAKINPKPQGRSELMLGVKLLAGLELLALAGYWIVKSL